jgi:hypothetical protein
MTLVKIACHTSAWLPAKEEGKCKYILWRGKSPTQNSYRPSIYMQMNIYKIKMLLYSLYIKELILTQYNFRVLFSVILEGTLNMCLYGSRYNGAQTFPGQNQLYQRQTVAPFTESEYIQNVYTKFEFITFFEVRSY